MDILFAIIWIVLTVLIEVWVALKFGIDKSQLSVVAIVNTITHGVLFVMLYSYIKSFPIGGSGIMLGLFYILGFFIEVLIEKTIYSTRLDSSSVTDHIKVANIASYVSGIFIAVVLGVLLGL